MNQDELTATYRKLYDYMAASNEPKYMRLFGKVMNEMMAWLIKNQPQAAEQWIDKLCAVKWEQYLSNGEAIKIVGRMKPEAQWEYETWQTAMQKLNLETERKGIFNEFAVWALMNAIYSDQADTLARYAFDEPIADVATERIVPLVHALAIGWLTDADGVFDIRKYFGVD